MEAGSSMSHSQGLSNNPYPEPNPVSYQIHSVNRIPRTCVLFLNKDDFCSMWLLASRKTPQAGGPFLVHDCLFNIFAANLHIWRPTPPSSTRMDAPCRGDRNPRKDLRSHKCKMAVNITYNHKILIVNRNTRLARDYHVIQVRSPS